MPGERNVDIMKKVTIKDVAQRAGVSSSTVSMILNGTKKFPEKTYRLVVDACNELGYIRGGTYRERQAEHKTLIAIVNLPPRKMMGLESNGMLISAVHTEKGEEKLHLIMVDDAIPAGAKLC